MDYPEERTAKIPTYGDKITLLLLITFLLSCNDKERLPYYNTADFTPLWEIDSLQHPLHTISSFSFVDQDNNPVVNETFDEKIYVANFFFTSCPGICSKMTSNLKVVAEQFRNNDEIQFISHSVTPWIDSVEQLQQFAKKHDIRSAQWHLVTGRQEEINSLARQSYFAEEEPGLTKDSLEFLHTEHCILVDRHRHIRGIYNGTLPLEMTRLAEDIEVLLSE